MKRWSSAQLLRAAEFVYATCALFALTQGPVYQVWKSSAERVETLPSPSMPFVYFASFIALQTPGVLLLARRLPKEWLTKLENRALSAFVCWMSLSTIWSTFSRHTLPEVTALIWTTLFGVYLGTAFSTRRLWWVIASAMTLGVGLSWFAVMRLWDGAFNFLENYWIGIYFNRNSLAPVAAMGIIAACGVVMQEFSRFRKSPLRALVFVVIPSLTLVVFASIEMWKSGSQTSPLALVAALASVMLWFVLNQLGAKIAFLRWLRSTAVLVTVAILGTALFVALREVGEIGGISNEVATLNSRRAFWSLSWSGILNRPWFGWGWMAAWRTPEFFNLGLWVPEWDTVWSHNGYQDVLLGGGVVAGALFLLYLFGSLLGHHNQPKSVTTSRILGVAFILTAATQESFFVGSHYMWALLVSALASSSTGAKSVNQQDAS